MLLLSAAKANLETANAAAPDSQAKNGSRIEDVVRRAQQIRREHGGFWGYDFDDWAEAWQQISQPLHSAPSAWDAVQDGSSPGNAVFYMYTHTGCRA
jgi:hypothetical protein